MITFMHCKTLGSMWVLGLESVVWLGLACGLVLRLGLVSGLYKWLFYLANCEATQPRRFKKVCVTQWHHNNN